jgi:hypothetical protein
VVLKLSWCDITACPRPRTRQVARDEQALALARAGDVSAISALQVINASSATVANASSAPVANASSVPPLARTDPTSSAPPRACVWPLGGVVHSRMLATGHAREWPRVEP